MAEKNDSKVEARLPRALVEAAKRKAAQQHRPLSQVVRDLLRTWLANTAHS